MGELLQPNGEPFRHRELKGHVEDVNPRLTLSKVREAWEKFERAGGVEALGDHLDDPSERYWPADPSYFGHWHGPTTKKPSYGELEDEVRRLRDADMLQATLNAGTVRVPEGTVQTARDMAVLWRRLSAERDPVGFKYLRQCMDGAVAIFEKMDVDCEAGPAEAILKMIDLLEELEK